MNGLIAATDGTNVVALDPVTPFRTALLNSTATDFEPEISPHGRKVAFSNGGNIITADFPSGSMRRQITSGADFTAPAWNPSSDRLVFDGPTGLNTAPAAGGGVTEVLGTVAGDGEPDYSPDGKFIVFDFAGEPGGIRRVNADNTGGRTTLLGGDGAGTAHPRVSPDGKMLAFACAEGICGLPFPDGGSRTVFQGTTAGDGMPNWSPDGTKIVFSSAADGIVTVNSNGTGGRSFLLSSDPGDAAPSWQALPVPVDVPPVVPPIGPVSFGPDSNCGGISMLRVLPLSGPSTSTVTASDTDPTRTLTLSASGVPPYVIFSATPANPAMGTFSINPDPMQFVPLLGAIIMMTPSNVNVTAMNNTPVPDTATCPKTIRVGAF